MHISENTLQQRKIDRQQVLEADASIENQQVLRYFWNSQLRI